MIFLSVLLDFFGKWSRWTQKSIVSHMLYLRSPFCTEAVSANLEHLCKVEVNHVLTVYHESPEETEPLLLCSQPERPPRFSWSWHFFRGQISLHLLVLFPFLRTLVVLILKRMKSNKHRNTLKTQTLSRLSSFYLTKLSDLNSCTLKLYSSTNLCNKPHFSFI